MQPIAIYIHWPFCKFKCHYCDFNSHVRDKVEYDKWLECFLKEIDYYKPYLNKKYIKSIFFGGGTPSLMPAFIPKAIISTFSEIALIDSNTEITLEANPSSSEAKNFIEYQKAGVNRLSIGIQALNDKDLRFLTRQHSASEAIEVIKYAGEIFSRYSFDLIYARPGQTLQAWEEELELAFSLAKGHISLYQLTIEKGTKFYKEYILNNFTLPNDEEAAKLFEFTTSYLKEREYIQYEVSNYAKAGHESLHNLAYWNYDDYIGIGPGAHGRISEFKNNKCSMYATSNIYNPENWIKSVEDKGHGLNIHEELTTKQILTEILMMGLRLKEGITDVNLKKFLGRDFRQALDFNVLKKLHSQGLILYGENFLKATDRGMNLLNGVLLELVEKPY